MKVFRVHDMTSLELGIALAELRGKIEGSYLKKFYDLGSGAFRFLFHGKSGNVIVYCRLGATFNETSLVEEAGQATNFAIAMRRRIEDSKVVSLLQHSSDRIAVIEVQAKGQVHRIVIEMFAKGNLVLSDSEGRIELCYKIASYKDREVRPKEMYVFPPSNSVGLDALTPVAINRILEDVATGGGRMIAGLSKHLNIGPIYLEEIITSAGLDPKAQLEGRDVQALGIAVDSFAKRARTPQPVVYTGADGSVLDYSVIALKKYEGASILHCESLNEALDRANAAQRARPVPEPSASRELEELGASIAKQRQLVDEFNRNSEAGAACGRTIFQRMGEINALVSRIRELKKPTLEELREEFPQLSVTEINLKDRKVTVDI